MIARVWPEMAKSGTHLSPFKSQRRQLPVLPRVATEVPSGDHRPVQNPPILPVAVVAPFSRLISPSLAEVIQIPEVESASHMESELSADADSS